MRLQEVLAQIDQAIANREYGKVVEIAQPYAVLGKPWAQVCVATLYQCGLGVPQDLRQAEQLFMAAAAKGHAGAWYSLGVLYETAGSALCSDPSRAAACYDEASKLGFVPGQPHDPKWDNE